MIIVTGSNGFIGKNFVNKLSNVYCVEMNDCFEFLQSFDRWNEVKAIVHQGAISSTTETDINKLHKYNVDFTLQLFQKAIEYQIPVKYASSASVYGNSNTINPLNYYAITKLQIDYWVEDNIDKFSYIQGFRYFNVYGKHEDHKGNQASPVHKFTQQARETGVIKVFEGSDEIYRDFICVDDLVTIVLYNGKLSGIFDLGTSEPISFLEVAELVAEKENAQVEIIPFPEHLKNKYQYYTCATKEFDCKFMTVEEYLHQSI